LLNLLNDILDQSKIEAGKFALRNVPFNLRDVIERTIKLFGKNAIAKNIDLASRIEDGTPMELQGDPDRLGQILSNLVSNAVKFTEKGGVTILVKPMGEKLGLHIVHFEVIDTGIGIMEEDQKLIFEPFTQADTSSTRKHGGTGLGLTISKQLVNMMGGTLIFSSTPGDGSTFGFTVGFAAACYKRPESSLRETTENKASEKTEEKAPIKTEEKFITAPPQPAKKFENIRILLAEDNPVNQIVEKKMLTLLGCNVKIVSNGQEAITAVSSETFDIVLMDCQMPIMDGFSATKLIRVWELQRKNAAVVSNKEFRRIPIIAATAHSLPEERLRCFDAGMDDFLSKPISMEAMTAALNKWLLMKDA
ncbi:MAG: ATP-binding protein, partial [Bdellovibrionales bacterium]